MISMKKCINSVLFCLLLVSCVSQKSKGYFIYRASWDDPYLGSKHFRFDLKELKQFYKKNEVCDYYDYDLAWIYDIYNNKKSKSNKEGRVYFEGDGMQIYLDDKVYRIDSTEEEFFKKRVVPLNEYIYIFNDLDSARVKYRSLISDKESLNICSDNSHWVEYDYFYRFQSRKKCTLTEYHEYKKEFLKNNKGVDREMTINLNSYNGSRGCVIDIYVYTNDSSFTIDNAIKQEKSYLPIKIKSYH